MPKSLLCSKANLQKDLTGKTYLVTGTTSGIGREIARQLARQHATILMGCRNMESAHATAAEITGETGNSEVHAIELDLGSLASVRHCAEELLSRCHSLDGLVNNAGVMNTPKGTTNDGFETQFGVNHLGPFLLTELLMPLLKAGAPSRIVHTSSVLHEQGEIDFSDIHFETRKYSGFKSYNQSKLANVLYAKFQATQLAGTGVSSFSIHPGWAQSKLAKHTMPLFVQNFLLKPLLVMAGMISSWESAQPALHVLLDDDVIGTEGAYYSQTSPLYKNKADKAGGFPLDTRNPAIEDADLCRRLYQVSCVMVGLKPSP